MEERSGNVRKAEPPRGGAQRERRKDGTPPGEERSGNVRGGAQPERRSGEHRTPHSPGAVAADHGGNGPQQDRQVEEDRPPLQIQEVETHELVEVELGAPGHLP